MKSGYDKFFKEAAKAKKKKKPVFPLGPFLISLVVCAAVSWCFLFPKEFDHLFQSVEIQFMGAASATDDAPAKSSATKVELPADSAAGEAKEKKSKTATSENKKDEDLSYLSKLTERKKELDLREKELGEMEDELHRQRGEVEARIKKLEEIRAQIGVVLKEKIETDQAKVDKLVEFYSNMKAKQAAEILSALNEDLAVEILGRMKKKNAADIMNLLTSAKAQVISEKFAGYKRR